jgi:hypothetical protein
MKTVGRYNEADEPNISGGKFDWSSPTQSLVSAPALNNAPPSKRAAVVVKPVAVVVRKMEEFAVEEAPVFTCVFTPPLHAELTSSDGKWHRWVLELSAKDRKTRLLEHDMSDDSKDSTGNIARYASRRMKQNRAQMAYLQKNKKR